MQCPIPHLVDLGFSTRYLEIISLYIFVCDILLLWILAQYHIPVNSMRENDSFTNVEVSLFFALKVKFMSTERPTLSNLSILPLKLSMG